MLACLSPRCSLSLSPLLLSLLLHVHLLCLCICSSTSVSFVRLQRVIVLSWLLSMCCSIYHSSGLCIRVHVECRSGLVLRGELSLEPSVAESPVFVVDAWLALAIHSGGD